nr:hypothetical protein [Sneathiella glossodoripedis]
MRFSGTDPLNADRVQDAIAAGEEKLGDSGRLLIRKSGTEPLIRVMGEGVDVDLVTAVVDDIVGEVEQVSS